MNQSCKVIAEFISGNAIGVVEEPADGQGEAMVKIGVLDRYEHCSEENFQEVIDKLRNWVIKNRPDCCAHENPA